MRGLLLAAILVPLAAFFIIQPKAFAQSSGGSQLMSAANQFYLSSQFSEATLLYQELVDQGIRDSTLYFNLGNAYFKQGNLGMAIVNYLRAERLSPRDKDIQANLHIARSQASDQLEYKDARYVARTASFTQPYTTLNELALATLGAWCLLIIFLTLFILWRRGFMRLFALAGMAIAVMLFATGLGLSGSRAYAESIEQVVIVADIADVSSGPGSHYVNVFTLHPGAEANLLEKRGSWVRLEIPGEELQGWVQASTVEQVGLEE